MELTLETYRKANTESSSTEIGPSKVTIEQAKYREIEELEAKLKDSGQNEILVDFKQGELDIEAPRAHSALKEVKLRLFMDEEAEAGLFHVVAKSAEDNSLIYTEPTLVRMVAL